MNFDFNCKTELDSLFEYIEDPSSELIGELTNDLIYSPENQRAPEQRGIPHKGDDPGPYNFEIALDISVTDRKKYVYSKLLNRVYLMMGIDMAVQFTWDFKQTKGTPLWVRATPVYSAGEHQEMKVTRCLIHSLPEDPSNKDIPKYATSNIMHSVRHDESVQYCGSMNDENHWLSLAVLMPSDIPTGVQAHQHVYRFGCKHSCTSGINRRKMEVLFTLETASGEILGRKSLGVRVCSCPRRDMDKDEKDCKLKNGHAEFAEPPKKKRLLKSGSDHKHRDVNNDVRTMMSFHNYQLPNGNNYNDIVNTAYTFNRLLHQALPPEHQAARIIQKAVAELAAIMNNQHDY